MQIKTLLQGMLAVSVINGCVIAIPAIAFSQPQPSAQLVAQTSNQLSEENIQQVLAAIQTAQEQEDVEGILKFLAPFVTSEITVESDDSTLTFILEGQAEHRELLKKTNALIDDRESLNQQIKIRITADGQLGIATISTVKEIDTENGEQLYTGSNDTIRFAWIDNQPKIISMTIKGWLAEGLTSRP